MASIWSPKIIVAVMLLFPGDSFLVFGSHVGNRSSLSTVSAKPTCTTETKMALPDSKYIDVPYANSRQLTGAPDGSKSHTAPPSVFQTKAMPDVSAVFTQTLCRSKVNDSAIEGNCTYLLRTTKEEESENDQVEENPGLTEHTLDTRITTHPTVKSNGETDGEALMQRSKFKESFSVSPVDELATSQLDPSNGAPSDQKLRFTCRGRCGLKISFPCGCSASCVVYQRCCEDMALDCPHVLQEGRTKLAHLLTSKIVCDQDSVMKITSCPIPKEDKKIPNENVPQEKAQNFGHLGTRWNETVSEKLNEALYLSAPVTEKFYGFTFVNKSIFDCHRMNYSFFTWRLQLKYRYQTPLSVRDLESLLKKNNLYVPTFFRGLFLSHLCSQHVVRTCKNSKYSENLARDYESKCQKSSTTLVFNISNIDKPVYYANKFCAFCNEGIHEELQLEHKNKYTQSQSGLHVVVSVSFSKSYTFKAINQLRIRYPLSWASVKCNITEAPSPQHQSSEATSGLSMNQTVCVADCEGNTFTLSPDGMCKARHIGYVALANDGLSQLCTSVFPRLANFFTCGMKNLIPSLRYADFQSTTVFPLFDTRVNQTLYLLKFQVDLPSPVTTNLAFDVENIVAFIFLANTFKNFRMSHNVCFDREKEKNIESGAKIVSDIPLTRVVFTQNVQLPSKRPQDGPITDVKNKTTICASTIYLAQNGREPPLILVCSDYRVLEDDVEMFRALSHARCFDLLTDVKADNSSPGRFTGNSGESAWLLTALLLLLHTSIE